MRGAILVLVGPAHADGPLLHHGQRVLLPLLVHHHGHRVQHGEGAGLDGLHGALQGGGHHDLVEHHAGLLDGAQHVAADHLVAGLGHGGEVPLLLPVQGGHLHATGQVVVPRLPHDALQGALDAVVDVLNDAGAQLHAHGRAGGLHHRAGAQAGGLLVHLDGRRIAVHVQNLADQALLAHPHHVGHVGVLQPRRHHQRAGDLDNFSAQCFNLLSRRRKLHILRVPVNGNAHSFRCASSSPARPTSLGSAGGPDGHKKGRPYRRAFRT